MNFIHIQCYYYYSPMYLFTFNKLSFYPKICLFPFYDRFLIHEYIHSHLLDVFIDIQRSISVHICERNIGSAMNNLVHQCWMQILCFNQGRGHKLSQHYSQMPLSLIVCCYNKCTLGKANLKQSFNFISHAFQCVK